MQEAEVLRALKAGLRLRCPNCEQGRIFRRFFRIEATCAHCNARFERKPGEATGAMAISLVIAEIIPVVGFFLLDALFAISITVQIVIWTGFILIFVPLTYRYARGLWVAVSYLAGDVYPDDAPAKSQE